MKDLTVLVFFYMIQALLMILTGLEFFNIKYKRQEIFMPVLMFGLTIWVVRKLYIFFHIPFGSHSFVLMILFFLILKVSLKIKYAHIFGIVLLDFSLVMLGGSLTGYFFKIFNLEPSLVMNNSLLFVLLGHVENTFLIILLAVLKIFKVNVFNIMEKIEAND